MEEKKILISVDISENLSELSKMKAELAELNKLNKTNGGLTQEQTKRQIELTDKVRTYNTVIRNQIKAESEQAGSIKKVSAELSVNRARWDEMSASEKKANQELLKTIQEQDKLVKSSKEATGRHQESVGNYKKVWEGITGTFAKVSGVVMGLWGAIKVGKSIIESSGAVADRWKEIIAGAKSGYEAFTRTIISGDWSNFITNIRNAITEGQRFTQTLTDLKDFQSALNIRSAQSNLEASTLFEKARLIKNKDQEQALKYVNQGINILNVENVEKQKLNKEIYDNQVQHLANLSGVGVKIIDLYLKNFDQQKSIIDKSKDYVNAQQMIKNKDLLKLSQVEVDYYQAIVNNADRTVKLLGPSYQKLENLRGEDIDNAREAYTNLYNSEKEFIDGKKRIQQFRLSLEEEITKKDEKEFQKRIDEKELQKRIDEEQAKRDQAYGIQVVEDYIKLQKSIEDANNKIYAENVANNEKRLELELGAVDLSIDTEENKAKKKLQIQLIYLNESLRLTREYFGELDENEQLQIQQLEQNIRKIQKALDEINAGGKAEGGEGGKTPTLLERIGLDEKGIQDLQRNANAVQDILRGIQDLQNVGFENEIRGNDAAYEAERNRIEKSSMTAKKKQKELAALEKKHKKEEYEMSLKQWKSNRDWALTQAIIQTALATITQFSTPGVGIALAVIAAATGALSIATILAEKPPEPPAYEKGGLPKGRNTLIRVNESGQEAVMTAGAVRMFPNELNAMNIAGGGAPLFTSSSTQKVTDNVNIVDGIIKGISELPAPILDYSEFTDFQTKTVKSQERARF